jgi:hypothetical protein
VTVLSASGVAAWLVAVKSAKTNWNLQLDSRGVGFHD